MPKSTPLRWHGGNGYIKHWMWSLAPQQGQYTHLEVAFAGALQDFWEMPHEGVSETINDVNGVLTNFYRVLRDELPELIRLLTFTPLSQREFQDAVERLRLSPGGTVRDAADFFIVHRQSRQGLGKDFVTPTRRVRRGMNEQVSAYLTAVDGLQEFCQRLRQVEIRNEHFRVIIPRYDHAQCFHIWDPPYLSVDEDGTIIRVAPEAYEFEMTLEEHVELLDLAAVCEGKFMLQGYPSKLYERYAKQHGWILHTKEFDAKSSSKKTKEKRVECLWTNYESIASPPKRKRRLQSAQ